MIRKYFKLNSEDCNTKMKKIFLILLIFICSCETTQTSSNMQNIKGSHKTIRNPKCEEIETFKVFQVLDNFVLATVCQEDENQYCLGHTVYFKKEKGKIYFDDQIIKVKNNECAIYTGTYRYQTQGGYKTVPIVKIIDSQIPNPE